MTDQEPTRFCLECGYPLDDQGSPRCPECGRGFDPENETTFHRGLTSPTKLYAANNTMEAHLLVAQLAQAGVRAVVMGSLLDMARGELPMTQETLPSVWVSATDTDRAMAVVREFTERTAEEPDEAGEPWTCPHCQEDVEGQFAVCWNCQAPRPDEQPVDEP